MMININCNLNCVHEDDGKCALTHISAISSTPHPACLNYEPKKNTNTAINSKTEP